MGLERWKKVWVTSIWDLSRLLPGSWFWLCMTRMWSPSCLMLWFRAVFLPLGGCEDFDMGKFSRNLCLKVSLFVCVWKNTSLLLVLKSIWILKQLDFFLSRQIVCALQMQFQLSSGCLWIGDKLGNSMDEQNREELLRIVWMVWFDVSEKTPNLLHRKIQKRSQGLRV